MAAAFIPCIMQIDRHKIMNGDDWTTDPAIVTYNSIEPKCICIK